MSTTFAYVYKWTQISTGKWYIGSKSSKGCHPNNHEKYKCSKLLVKTLITENRNDWVYEIWDIGDPLEIRELERIYLTILNAKSNHMSYNESNGYWDPGNRLGRKESSETRQKKSIARQGEKNPMFGKRGELCPHYGKQYTEERRKNQSLGVLEYAKARPESHNKNISAALKGNPNVGCKGEKNGMFGKPATEYNKAMSKLKNSGSNNPMCKPENQRICEHCEKKVAKNHYTMYHGDKCKSRIKVEV
jgi:hypothetical protein